MRRVVCRLAVVCAVLGVPLFAVARPGVQCRVAVDGVSRAIRGRITAPTESLEAACCLAESGRLRADPAREDRPPRAIGDFQNLVRRKEEPEGPVNAYL
jgi:hypothetical protein